MARNRTKQLRNAKHPISTVDNNMGWLTANWTKYKLRINTYTDCMNIILSQKWGFKRRRTATQLWVEPDSNLDRVYGIWYQKDFWWIRVKWDRVQTLATPSSTWTTIVSWYTITWNNFVDFIEFKATATSGSTTNTISEESAERYLKVNTLMTANEHIWKLLKIWSEYKLIIWNTTTIIYIQERFEWTYAASTTVTITDQVNAVYIISPGKDVKIWRGWATLETLWFSFDRAVLQSHGWLRNNGRLFWIKNDSKVYVSEVGTWEFFQKDSFMPVNIPGNLIWISEVSGRIVVYADFWRLSIVWDNPDNFQVIPTKSTKWTLSAGSIASWNNVEYYLSHEGIEFLQSVEWSTVTEWISLSDNIKEKFKQHTDFSWSHGTVSNGKYFLNIQWLVYIYDLENSVKFHKPIFTLAEYDECSQEVVSNAVAWEWTCSMDVSWQLVFWQGWLTYRITDEKIWPEDTQSKLKYMIEFPIQDMWDLRLTKAIQRYWLHLQNDKSLVNARTDIKIYFSKNEEAYTLARQVENIFDIEVFFSEKVWSYSIKIEIEDLDNEIDTQIEFLYSELQFYFLNKR